MVELAQVGELVRGHVVDQMRRQHHRAPVKEYPPVRAAAAPAGLRVGETDARNVKTERACEPCDALAEELQCPRPHPIERPLAQARSVGESQPELSRREPGAGFSEPQGQRHDPSEPRNLCPGLPDKSDTPRSGEALLDPALLFPDERLDIGERGMAGGPDIHTPRLDRQADGPAPGPPQPVTEDAAPEP